jgi:hypothetical protein
MCLRHASLHIEDHPQHQVKLVDMDCGSWMIGSDGSFRASSTPSEVDIVCPDSQEDQIEGTPMTEMQQQTAVPEITDGVAPKLADAAAPKSADAAAPKSADAKSVDPKLMRLQSFVSEPTPSKLVQLVTAYLIKFRGEPGAKLPPYPPKSRLIAQLWVAFAGTFISIGLMAAIHHHILEPMEKSMLIANFGASAIIVFLGYDTPFAQPRSVILGTVASAFVGMATAKLLISDSSNGGFDEIDIKEAGVPWLASALAVSVTVVVQILLRIVHPPGGAAALIPCLLPAVRDGLGWWYIMSPVLPGTCILVLCGALLNNMSPYRQYPKYWAW